MSDAPAGDARAAEDSDPGAARAEAGRLSVRLASARAHLDAAAESPRSQPARSQPPRSQPRAPGASAQDISRADAPGARGSGDGARIEGADDEVRALLGPTVDRLARLADLAGALADGTLSEEAAVPEIAELAATQPTRGAR